MGGVCCVCLVCPSCCEKVRVNHPVVVYFLFSLCLLPFGLSGVGGVGVEGRCVEGERGGRVCVLLLKDEAKLALCGRIGFRMGMNFLLRCLDREVDYCSGARLDPVRLESRSVG